MTPNLLKVSRTCTKLYRKCIGKQRSDTKYKKYIKHRNEYNYLKRSAKQTYYNEIFIKYRNDIRNTWKTINSIIGKQNDKSNTAQRFKINGNLVSEPKQISNNFCDFFTNVGHDYASKIPKSKYDAKHYLHLNKIKQTKSIFITPSDTEEIRQILGKLKCKNSSGHDELSCRKLSVNLSPNHCVSW